MQRLLGKECKIKACCASLRAKDAKKMNVKDRTEKLKELKMELIRANVTANKANSHTKEIKRAISRLLTFNKADKTATLKKK